MTEERGVAESITDATNGLGSEALAAVSNLGGGSSGTAATSVVSRIAATFSGKTGGFAPKVITTVTKHGIAGIARVEPIDGTERGYRAVAEDANGLESIRTVLDLDSMAYDVTVTHEEGAGVVEFVPQEQDASASGGSPSALPPVKEVREGQADESSTGEDSERRTRVETASTNQTGRRHRGGRDGGRPKRTPSADDSADVSGTRRERPADPAAVQPRPARTDDRSATQPAAGRVEPDDDGITASEVEQARVEAEKAKAEAAAEKAKAEAEQARAEAAAAKARAEAERAKAEAEAEAVESDRTTSDGPAFSASQEVDSTFDPDRSAARERDNTGGWGLDEAATGGYVPAERTAVENVETVAGGDGQSAAVVEDDGFGGFTRATPVGDADGENEPVGDGGPIEDTGAFQF